VKEFLSREGHAFLTKNVDEDHSAYDELLALGFRAVPVTIVNGLAVKGFDEPALRKALAASES
jgi:glutaredoxin-like protein NrdH